MNIVFMGTPDFAVCALEGLIQNFTVSAVFTQPDRPKGRGHKLCPSPVKELALSHNIEVFTPLSMKDEEIFATLKKLNPDYIVVVAFGKILPKTITDNFYCINVHGSILPKYRGASPIETAVINGETETGVTIMKMDEGIDTGDILTITKTQIFEEETGGELRLRLAEMGKDALIDTLKNIENITPKKQDNSQATITGKITKEDLKIDFNKTPKQIVDHIRGLNNMGPAYFELGGERYKVYRGEITNFQGDFENGVLVKKDTEIIFSCGGGFVKITEMMAPNSKRMAVSDFLRGHKL